MIYSQFKCFTDICFISVEFNCCFLYLIKFENGKIKIFITQFNELKQVLKLMMDAEDKITYKVLFLYINSCGKTYICYTEYIVFLYYMG